MRPQPSIAPAMTLTQLRYLVAIADSGLNITLAAERVQDAVIFLGAKAVLGNDFGGDAGGGQDGHARPLASTGRHG